MAGSPSTPILHFPAVHSEEFQSRTRVAIASFLCPQWLVVSTPAFPLLGWPGPPWFTPACAQGAGVVCACHTCAVSSNLESSPFWFIFLLFHSTDIFKRSGPFGTVSHTLYLVRQGRLGRPLGRELCLAAVLSTMAGGWSVAFPWVSRLKS